MKTSTKIVIGLMSVMLVFGILGVISIIVPAISLHNEFVGYETQIVALHDDVPNIITKTTNTVASKANVVNAYREDFNNQIKNQISGRYGKDGSKAMWQWIQEHNIQMDTSMFKEMMRDIEAGNNEMQNRQTEILEIKRIYDNRLRQAVPSFYNSIFLHFPKIDMKKYGDLILNDTARQASETKTLNAINPFEKTK